MVGCSSAKKKEEEPNLGGGVPTAAAAEDNTITGDSDSGKAMGIQTIHFPFDSFIIDEEGKRIASSNADILKTHSNFKIQIEGHCDQRGGIQYNLALGEKRANAVRNYIADLGVAHDRMTIISFGKEKLIDPGTSEEAYARNRRANFVITSH
jgi:peptidoglycan-associated lipoprotein